MAFSNRLSAVISGKNLKGLVLSTKEDKKKKEKKLGREADGQWWSKEENEQSVKRMAEKGKTLIVLWNYNQEKKFLRRRVMNCFKLKNF